MDIKTSLGDAMTRWVVRCVLLVFVALTVLAVPASAADRFALIVSGASGGDKYAENQKKWLASLESTLRERLAFAGDRLVILSEGAAEANNATRDNVTRALTTLRQRVTAADVLLVVLIGHGTFDGQSAKFNLIGPDMSAEEWKKLLEGIPGRLVFVNTTSSSFPFIEELSGQNRVIISATDTSAQKYDTVFPEYFIKGLAEVSADNDKNGRLSVFEAFSYANQAVKQYYDQQGQLATERSLIDDNGVTINMHVPAQPASAGAQPAAPPTAVLARMTYLDPEPGSTTANPVLAALQKQKASLEAQIEGLKLRKGELTQPQYDAELERLAGRPWAHPATGEPVQFGVSTIERWYYAARNERRDPVGVLRRRVRKDLGQQPSLGPALRVALRAQYQAHQSWSYQLHVDNLAVLVAENGELGSMPSYPTLRRYMKEIGVIGQ
jgi:hypothetical protein